MLFFKVASSLISFLKVSKLTCQINKFGVVSNLFGWYLISFFTCVTLCFSFILILILSSLQSYTYCTLAVFVIRAPTFIYSDKGCKLEIKSPYTLLKLSYLEIREAEIKNF